MTIKFRNAILATSTIVMLGSTIYLYDNEKPVLDYMEYLPVYRVEQLWERREQQALQSSHEMDERINAGSN